MAKIKIANSEISQDLLGNIVDFPKYTTQIINLANQNAQGTRPKVVGQMSDLIQDFKNDGGRTYSEWVNWYQNKMPQAIDDSTEKIWNVYLKMKEADKQIDKSLIRAWVTDLLLTKTFAGLCFQEIILKKVSSHKNVPYRLAKPEEESKGIDGYIGAQAVSIKPLTYKTENRLPETIEVPIIFYDKKKDGLVIEFDL